MICYVTDIFGVQGATIRRDEVTGAVVVARIMRGGAADRSGELVTYSSCFFCFSPVPLELVRKQSMIK